MSSRIRRLVPAIGAAAALVLTGGTAMASGGSGSGGSGSGGGGGSTTTPTGCTITGFSNSTGYYSVYAAIWTKFSISTACGYAVNWQMTYTNGTTGNVDFARGSSTAYMASGTIDEDWAAFSTDYTVALTVTDPTTGAVIDSRSAIVTTKAPKTGA